mgnify:CR=1 FL=1
MRLVFVTCTDYPDLTEDDRYVQRFLQSKNIQVDAGIWTDEEIDWSDYDVVILRSTWDYFYNPIEFSRWLDRLEKACIQVLNPVPVIRWNLDKKYLFEIESKGIRIPPSVLVRQNESLDLYAFLLRNSWDKAVVKPVVSAGAYRTFTIDRADAIEKQSLFDRYISEQDFIIQRFSNEIIQSGELSLIYFNKKYSHSVLKKPKANEFRVQFQYGGKHIDFTPNEDLLKQIDHTLSFLPNGLLFTRVDGYLDADGFFCHMEIELTEPMLFFDKNDDRCNAFYFALQDWMRLSN